MDLINIKEEPLEQDNNLSDTVEKSPKNNLSAEKLLAQLSQTPLRKFSFNAETYSDKPIKSSRTLQPNKDSFLLITSHQTPKIVRVERDITSQLATQFSQTSNDNLMNLRTALQPVTASRAIRTSWSPTPLEQFKSRPHPQRTELPGSLLKKSSQKTSQTFRSLNQSIKSKTTRSNLCLPTGSFKNSVRKLKEGREVESPTPIVSMSTRTRFTLPKPLCGLIETSNSVEKSSDYSENQRNSSQLSIAPLITSQPKKRSVKVVSMESLYFGKSSQSRFEDESSFRTLKLTQEPKSQERLRNSRGKPFSLSGGEKRTQLESMSKTRNIKKNKQETKESGVVTQKREPERVIVKRNLISGTFVVLSHPRAKKDVAFKATSVSHIQSGESPKSNSTSKILPKNKGKAEGGKEAFPSSVNSDTTGNGKATKKKQYKCRICNVTYVSFKEVQEHLLKAHSMT